MKKLYAITLTIAMALVLLVVLLLVSGEADAIGDYFNIKWLEGVSKKPEVVGYNINTGSIPEYRLIPEFFFQEDNPDLPLETPTTATEVACLIARQIKNDFIEYGMDNNRYGWSLGELDANLLIISPDNPIRDKKDTDVSGIGRFKIKKRIPTSLLRKYNIGYDDTKVIKKIDEMGNVETEFVNYDDTNYWEISKYGSEKDEFEAGVKYWSFEDLSYNLKELLIKSCSDVAAIFFEPCPSPYVDEECVTHMLSNMRIGADDVDEKDHRYLCTGINQESGAQHLMGGKDPKSRLYFGNEVFSSKYAYDSTNGKTILTTDKIICPRGPEMTNLGGSTDMISAWKGFGSVDSKVGRCKEHIIDDEYFGDNAFPPYTHPAINGDPIDRRCQYDYAWIVLWNKAKQNYEIWIPTISEPEYKEEVAKDDYFFKELADYFIRKSKRNLDVGAYRDFRAKYSAIIVPEEDITLSEFVINFKEKADDMEKGWMSERFTYEGCIGDDCKNHPVPTKKNGYKFYKEVEIFEESSAKDTYNELWSDKQECPNGPDKPSCFHIRTPLDKNNGVLLKGKEYEIVLYDWESNDKHNFKQVIGCGATALWDEEWHWCTTDNEDSGEIPGLVDPTIQYGWSGCKWEDEWFCIHLAFRRYKLRRYRFNDYALAIIPLEEEEYV